jgi:hypothetical protein
MRDRLRPAVLVRKVLLPPVLAGAAVCCVLGALALTISSGSRAGAPNPLARTTVYREPLAIGLSLELGVTARPGSGQTSAPAEPVSDRSGSGLARQTAATTSTLARPVAGVVGGCGTFGCPRPGHLHHGVDFLAAAGTPVHAAASGLVALVQSPARSAGYGNFVCVQHRPALATCYAHLSAVAARVRLGARVRRGQLVGLVGATGSASTPHLHFEVRRGPAGCGQCAVDPLALLPRAAGGAGAPIAGPDEVASARGGEGPVGAAPAPSNAHGGEAPVAATPAPPPDPPAQDDATTLVEAKPARPDRIALAPEAPPPVPVASAPIPPATPLAPDAPAVPPG